MESVITRKQGIIRKVEDIITSLDSQEITVLFYRNVTDTTIIILANRGIRGFIREVKSTAGNFDSIEHGVDFFRFHADTVNAGSSLFRKLEIFIRIATQLFLRDFFLGRFLKAKTEVILKSCITREITLESRIS
jgi:hypothetical protein